MGHQKSQETLFFQNLIFGTFYMFSEVWFDFFSGRHLYLRVKAKKQNRSSKYGSDFDIFSKI